MRANLRQTICYSELYGYVKLLFGSTHSRFKSATYHADIIYADKLNLLLFDGWIRKSGNTLATIVTLDVDQPEAAEALRQAVIDYKAHNGLLPIFLTTSASGLTKAHCGFGIARGEVSADGGRFKVDTGNSVWVEPLELARILAYELGFPEEHLDLRGIGRCFCTPSFLAAMERVEFVSPDLTAQLQEGWRSISKSERAPVAAAQTSDFAEPAASLQAEAMIESLTANLPTEAASAGLTLRQTQLLWLLCHVRNQEGEGQWLSHTLACKTLGIIHSHYYQILEALCKKGFIECADPDYQRGRRSRRWTVLVNPWATSEESPTRFPSSEAQSPQMSCTANAQSYIDSHASGYSSGTFNDLEVKACVWAVHRNIPADQLLTAFHSIEGWGEPRRVRRLLGTFKWAQRKIFPNK